MGTSQSFDDDGIMYSETIFEKGRLRDIKFFDKKASVISNTTSRKGDATIQFYDANANKTSEGHYDKDGSANGSFTYYFKSGKTSAEAIYKNDLLKERKHGIIPMGKKVKKEIIKKERPMVIL